MLEIYQIPAAITLRAGVAWKCPFRVGSKLNGAAPANWADMTVRVKICSASDLTQVLRAAAVVQGASGNFEATLSAADIAAIAVSSAKAVFLYMVAGDANVYGLALADVVVDGGLPAW